MSVENKIKELLGRKTEQLQEEAKVDLASGGVADTGAKASANAKKDTSKASTVAVAGDTTQPSQGSSQKASFTTRDEDEQNQGAKAAAPVGKDTTLPKSKGDAKSVKTQAMEEVEEDEDSETIQEVSIKDELASIFGEDLSEEFRTKATSIFEAAVIARVNSEMEKIVEKLEESNAQQLLEYKEVLVEKVDSYLNYVVEQWMEENQLAVESGLRNEITEEFITGLKGLFQEHYIDVPEEKYDVIEDLADKVDSLKEELDESISDNIEMAKQFIELKKAVIFAEQTDGLADTEVDKLMKLVEGVDFESEELYAEKLAVIKENYFPREGKKSPEQVLIEGTATGSTFEDNGVMSKYVQAISRSIKSR